VPDATSATPAKEAIALSQNASGSRSSPTTRAKSATKTGVEPSTSATVDAVVNFSE